MKKIQYYAHELINQINKKYFTYDRHENPVKILDCNTYKTGKHGHAKTTLRMEDLFTENVVSDIVESDYLFYNAESNNNYESMEAEISKIHYHRGTKTYSVDLVTYTESFELTAHQNVKLHQSAVKDLEKHLERKQMAISETLDTDDVEGRFTTSLILFKSGPKTSKICLNFYFEVL